MHLRHVEIRHFKGVRSFSSSFLREDGSPRPLTMLLGANGAGKTTVLQAIALVVSLATRKRATPSEFDWPGFLLERIGSSGPTRVEVVLGFDETERAAIVDLHQRWKRSPLPPSILDSVPAAVADASEITVSFEDGELRCDRGPEGLALCLGRYFIRTTLRWQPDLRTRFFDVGDVFWFDQNRTLLSADIELPGIAGLRQYLIGWYATHHTRTLTSRTSPARAGRRRPSTRSSRRPRGRTTAPTPSPGPPPSAARAPAWAWGSRLYSACAIVGDGEVRFGAPVGLLPAADKRG